MNEVATHRNDTMISMQLLFRICNLVLVAIMERIVFSDYTNSVIIHRMYHL